MSRWFPLLSSSFRPAIVVCLLLLAAQFGGCGAGDPFEPRGAWPEFRGPDGQGRAPEGMALPASWAPGSDNIRWRTEVDGVGNSSPIVVEGQIIVTLADPPPPMDVHTDKTVDRSADKSANPGEKPLPDDLRRSVASYDLTSGELLWRTDLFRAPPEEGHFLNTNAAPTPLTDGEHVWVFFGKVLAKLELDGEIVWQRDVDPIYTDHVRYGVASSPIFAGGLLILFQDREWAETTDIGWLAAFDPETGDEIWRNEWSHTCCAYTTPAVWLRRGVEELVIHQSAAVVSYDPATGERLWRSQHGMLQTVAGLNLIDDEVICAFGGAHRNKSNLCLRVTGTGEAVQVEELWQGRRRSPESASPVAYDGRIYAVTEAGVMSCYDPYTGEVHWLGRLKKGRGYRSSLVAGDGKIYAQSTWAVTAVVDASADELKVLSYSETPEGGNNATPAVAGGCLILRTLSHLYCIEAESSEAG